MSSAENERAPTVERYAEADVPTEYGLFKIVVFRETGAPDPSRSEHGVAERGVAERGVAERGVAEHGAAEHGAAEHGAAEHGAAEHGAAEHGAAEHVAAEHGAAEHGAAEHVAIVKGDPSGKQGVHVRVHSECLTGEVLHSLKCDCREQLDYALRHIGEEDTGVVLYLRQEGRGIGLGNKIRAYALQQRGVDTVDANRALGFGDDLRRYEIATDMLADLGVRSVVLLTNNPAKVEGLRADGVVVSGRLPVHVAPNEHNRDYLLTKRARMGHMLSNLADLLLDAE